MWFIQSEHWDRRNLKCKQNNKEQHAILQVMCYVSFSNVENWNKILL